MNTIKGIVNYTPTEKEILQVKNAWNILSEHMIIYTLKSNMIIHKNIHPNEKNIDLTIHDFFKIRENIFTIKQSKINQLISDFKLLRNNDFIFALDDKHYSFHTMRLLCFIFDALQAYTFSLDKRYLAGTVAKKPTTKTNFILNVKYHENQLNDPSVLIKTEHTIKYYVYDMLIRKPKLTKYFLGVFSLIPIHQIKMFYEEDEVTQLLVDFLSFFSSATLTKNQIALSLAIALNFYMRFRMNLQPKVIEPFIEYVTNTCFSNHKDDIKLGYKSSELLKNIHLVDTINFIPIFSIATKQEQYYSHDETHTLYTFSEEVKKDLNIVLDLPIEYQKNLITNPLYLYSTRFPLEMLEKI